MTALVPNLPLFLPGVAAEPVRETCRAQARVIAWGEALIIHLDAVVERLGIGDDGRSSPGAFGSAVFLPLAASLL